MMTTTTTDNPIKVETIKGREYFHRFNDFHELIFWDYYASKFYSHLCPNPFKEEWEHEEAEESGEATFRDMETLALPMLLNDEGDELEIEQVIELYGIKPTHVAGSSRYLENSEVEMWHWVNGERDEFPS